MRHLQAADELDREDHVMLAALLPPSWSRSSALLLSRHVLSASGLGGCFHLTTMASGALSPQLVPLRPPRAQPHLARLSVEQLRG